MKTNSLIIIKPDATKRGLVGEILLRLERAGITISDCKSVFPTKSQIFDHYEHLESDVLENVWKYMGDPMHPLLIFVVCGYNCINACRKLIGATQPFLADPGTIRGDFGTESYDSCANPGPDQTPRAIPNLVHASDSKISFEREMGIWFPEFEGIPI